MAEIILQANGRLVLFAEGRLSRTGTLMKLFDGTGFLLNKTNAKVITCYLRGANRLPYSPNPGLKRCFPTITAHFSDVLVPPKVENLNAIQTRAKLTGWLRDQMVNQQFNIEMEFGPHDVLSAIAAAASERSAQTILEDASHQRLTYRRLLRGCGCSITTIAAVTFPGTDHVGILLPNINAVPSPYARPVAARQNPRHPQFFHWPHGYAGLLPIGRSKTNHHLPRLPRTGQIKSRFTHRRGRRNSLS